MASQVNENKAVWLFHILNLHIVDSGFLFCLFFIVVAVVTRFVLFHQLNYGFYFEYEKSNRFAL